jgi:hypothetical protein
MCLCLRVSPNVFTVSLFGWEYDYYLSFDGSLHISDAMYLENVPVFHKYSPNRPTWRG